MATYKEIQDWVQTNYDFVPQTCWIAEVKFECGINVTPASNRQSSDRIKPCPTEKKIPIKKALEYFTMI